MRGLSLLLAALCTSAIAHGQMLIREGGLGLAPTQGGGGGPGGDATCDAVRTELIALHADWSNLQCASEPDTTTSSTADTSGEITSGIASGNHVTILAGSYTLNPTISVTDTRITCQPGVTITGTWGGNPTEVLVEGCNLVGPTGAFQSMGFGNVADLIFKNNSITNFYSIEFTGTGTGTGTGAGTNARFVFANNIIEVEGYAPYNDYARHGVFVENTITHEAGSSGSSLIRLNRDGSHIAFLDNVIEAADRAAMRTSGSWSWFAALRNEIQSGQFAYQWGAAVGEDPVAEIDFFIYDNVACAPTLTSNLDGTLTRWRVDGNDGYGSQHVWPSGGDHTIGTNSDFSLGACPL